MRIDRPLFRWALLAVACALPVAAAGQDREPSKSSATEATDQEAPATLQEARDLLIEGKYAEASAAFESLRGFPKTAAQATMGLFDCHMSTGDYTAARSLIEALDKHENADLHLRWARVCRRTGDYEPALRHARRALALDGNLAGARLLLGSMLESLGRREEALETYRPFERSLVGETDLKPDAAWLTATGLGFLRYSVLTQTQVSRRTEYVLTEMLQVAYERVDRRYWPARIAAADLLREKYNNEKEDGSVADYLAALRINEHLPEALVGLGSVALDSWNFEEAERRAEAALEINANYPPALHLLASTRLKERRYQEAIDVCERALAINPNDLLALSLSSSASACRYDGARQEELRLRVEAINPTCALYYRTLGNAMSGIRQYAASERALLKAIDYEPTNANARTELGLMYMQWGWEGKARDALEASWNLDPFNQRSKFTLDLLDSLERFERHETEHFIILFDAAQDPVMGTFIAEYMEEIHEQVTADFETTLPQKTIIQLFPTQRSFAVRITGNPWIHTIGACTGRVIALASPRQSAELTGRYDIARVLKHEFTHTVTLAATNNRIPHWFTEGLAVSEEDAPRAFPWMEQLANAARRGALFTLESIDWGFIRPKRPGDRQMAYAQSEWMCEYIVERAGYDMLQTMLNRYREGLTQEEVFAKELGISLERFDGDFLEWARRQVLEWGFDLSPPEDVAELRKLAQEGQDDAALLGRLARAEWDDGNLEDALTAARRTIKLDPNNVNGLTTLVVALGRYGEQAKHNAEKRPFDDEALPVAERLLELDPTGWAAPKALGEIALRRRNWDEAIKALKHLQRRCPADPTSWRGLAGIYLDRDDDDLALPQLIELARSEDQDPDIAAQIARISRKKGRLGEARYWYRRALYIAPASIELHKALGDTLLKSSDATGALREYETLTLLEPNNARHFEDAALAAQKSGNADRARALAKKAVELDADSTARSLLD